MTEKIVMITGAAGGIGSVTSQKFIEENITHIIITDLNEEGLNALYEKTKDKTNVIPIVQDVTKESDWDKVVSIVEQEFGKLDILINNAGGSNRQTIENTTLDEWNRIISLNQTSTFLGMKKCLPLLKKSGQASIVNVSSVAGLTGYFSAPYTAAKWAVRGLTKTAAMEFSKWNIRVNSVHPGYVLTPLTENVLDVVENFNKINALERIGKPEEVANAIVYLASEESSYMTGSEIVIDGGLTAGGGLRMITKQVGIY